jgi:peptide chain release factor subunit 1
VTDLDHSLLRKLAEWVPIPAGVPITSLYLTVDGRRFPRKADYLIGLDELLRDVRGRMNGLDALAARSVERDLGRMREFVREEFDRGDTRGLALFSAHDAGLWQEVRVPRPVRDRAVVGPQADLLPLESLLETYPSVCTALVDYEKARLFLLALGRIQEVHGVWDDVPNRHDQGGWAQMRMQRHVDDHRIKHVRRVADTLFRLWQTSAFEHLILAGPAEAHHDLEHELHDYLRRRVRAQLVSPITASAEEVRKRSLAIEEELEREAEQQRLEQILNAAGAGAQGVTGLDATLAALADDRIRELVVGIDLSEPGGSCAACGRLASTAGACPACGEPMREIADVVEAAVAQAYRQGCRVETVVDGEAVSSLGGIGALLRF